MSESLASVDEIQWVALKSQAEGRWNLGPTLPVKGKDDLKRGLEPGSQAGMLIRVFLPQLSQHMKLKLQFTASVSHPPPEARPLSRKSSPSSPAVRDLVERHQASLGRSQSFSHQQPSRSHLMRYGTSGRVPLDLTEAGNGGEAGRGPEV